VKRTCLAACSSFVLQLDLWRTRLYLISPRTVAVLGRCLCQAWLAVAIWAVDRILAVVLMATGMRRCTATWCLHNTFTFTAETISG